MLGSEAGRSTLASRIAVRVELSVRNAAGRAGLLARAAVTEVAPVRAADRAHDDRLGGGGNGVGFGGPG
jgi:hypothetical protein